MSFVGVELILAHLGVVGLLSIVLFLGIEKLATLFWWLYEVFLDMPFYLELLFAEPEVLIVFKTLFVISQPWYTLQVNGVTYSLWVYLEPYWNQFVA